MKTAEIRRRFLDFFATRGHEVEPLFLSGDDDRARGVAGVEGHELARDGRGLRPEFPVVLLGRLTVQRVDPEGGLGRGGVRAERRDGEKTEKGEGGAAHVVKVPCELLQVERYSPA